ncbi:ferric reductase-like transmembrane domain-containing protein [Pseudooceanicola sp. C21-150M6]|uniref:ferric reductase-like transmembrane domain-containing protein n=1 Tax=Pseudooceanicola sp. C21-150M6 TaxID=3434355 RepID=UPI003D7FDB23
MALALIVPIAVAAASPLLQWRTPVYIGAGLAGVAGLGLLLLQPLLALGLLTETRRDGRQLHRWGGALLVVSVALHIAGLWLTSPPDVVDALLFRSPTPFSAWGVIATWALIATSILSLMRRWRAIRPAIWQLLHAGLALSVVGSTILHAWLIDGTMGDLSKAVLCGIVAVATLAAVLSMPVVRRFGRRAS